MTTPSEEMGKVYVIRLMNQKSETIRCIITPSLDIANKLSTEHHRSGLGFYTRYERDVDDHVYNAVRTIDTTHDARSVIRRYAAEGAFDRTIIKKLRGLLRS